MNGNSTTNFGTGILLDTGTDGSLTSLTSNRIALNDIGLDNDSGEAVSAEIQLVGLQRRPEHRRTAIRPPARSTPTRGWS